jgi:hypothetical protein
MLPAASPDARLAKFVRADRADLQRCIAAGRFADIPIGISMRMH